MSNLNNVRNLANQILGDLKENKHYNLNEFDNVVIDELLSLISAYPQLIKFIDAYGGKMPLLDIIDLFFKLLAEEKNINQRDHYLRLKSFSINQLHTIILVDYLLAGIGIFLAIDFCVNHKNTEKHIKWHIDYTDSYNQIVKNTKPILQKSKTEKGKSPGSRNY